MSLVIGLTGSIGTGKSTVSKMLRDRKIPVIDADEIAKKVVEPGQAALEDIKTHFGSSVVTPDGTLNRQTLGKIIFEDEAERKALNKILHPVIKHEMLKIKDDFVEKNERLIILDIPLLFETEFATLVDKIVVVYTTPKRQLNRLMEREALTEQQAKLMMNTQLPIEKKKEWADYVVDNNGTKEETEKQIETLLNQLLSLA